MIAPLMLGGNEVVPVVAVIACSGLCLVGMISSAMRRSRTERELEESRRELAAYVAEGSISPEDAAKLLNAGKGWRERAGC